jgi:hypothetical protein
MKLNNPNNDRYEVRDGKWVNQRVAQVVQAIHEYSPDLVVEYLPEGARTQDQAAFRIMHYPPGGQPYPIFHVKSEAEFDTRVLMRIIAGDQRNKEVTYSMVEAAEKAAQLVAKQKWEDERDEAIDKMYHALHSPLNTYKLDKDTTIKAGIPFNAKGY